MNESAVLLALQYRNQRTLPNCIQAWTATGLLDA
jgi:hypothetical protein